MNDMKGGILSSCKTSQSSNSRDFFNKSQTTRNKNSKEERIKQNVRSNHIESNFYLLAFTDKNAQRGNSKSKKSAAVKVKYITVIPNCSH